MQGFKKDELNTERFLNLRYDGTDVPVMTLCPEGGDFAQASPPVVAGMGSECPVRSSHVQTRGISV